MRIKLNRFLGESLRKKSPKLGLFLRRVGLSAPAPARRFALRATLCAGASATIPLARRHSLRSLPPLCTQAILSKKIFNK
jgi:hypothetical protein